MKYYIENDVKCRLIAYEKYSKTTITFFKNVYNKENYLKSLSDLKMNLNIDKIIKVENGEEEVLFEKQKQNK